MIQLDIAENYTCHSCEEVQSAHWNKTSVTLLPVVCISEELKTAHWSTSL